MTISEARNLKPGDKVITLNGRYTQNGTVIFIEPHHREGWWITYHWNNPKGKTITARKRHTSVYLPEQFQQ